MNCDCTQTEIRWKPFGQGRVYTHQCQVCGRGVGRSVRRQARCADGWGTEPRAWNPSLPHSRSKPRGNKKRRVYLAFIRGSAWAKQRDRVMERDLWACQNCGDTECRLEVDHVRYTKRIEDTPDDWLQTLCAPCHRAITASRRYRTREMFGGAP